MYCAIHDRSGLLVSAASATANDGPFRCPTCDQDVFLRRGAILSPHFAHIQSCHSKRGESKFHLGIKSEIYESLFYTKNALTLSEHRIGDHRADVYCEFESKRLVIEVQCSFIEESEIVRRMREFTSRGMTTLWVIGKPLYDMEGEALPCPSRLFPSQQVISVPNWIKTLQKIGGGVVFYHQGKGRLEAVHYTLAYPWVEEFGPDSPTYRNLGSYMRYEVCPRSLSPLELRERLDPVFNVKTAALPQDIQAEWSQPTDFSHPFHSLPAESAFFDD